MSQSKCACCLHPHTQFDFWEGSWSVFDTNGVQVGQNAIRKIESNCILQESWRGSTGTTGTSINYYNQTDSTWNQVWVDNQGSVLNLKGGLINGKMVLRSEPKQGKDGFYYDEVTWEPTEGGNVVQSWFLYDLKGDLIRTLFVGVYRKEHDEK